MTQPQLALLSELTRTHGDALTGEGVYLPNGSVAYGTNGEKIGTIRDALVDPSSGKLRYLITDVGGWFSSKEVLIPVGHARITDDGVYFDNLTREQARDLGEYRYNEMYADESYESDERVLLGADRTATVDETARTAYRETAYRTPERLQLLEERLVVNKDRFQAGSVEIGKHVETREQQVNVALEREEVIIERHTVTDGQAVTGAVLGEGQTTMRVDLEAERANVGKEAYVVEEVEVGKRTVTDNQVVTETVGREVLDVTKTGEVRIDDGSTTTTETSSTTNTTNRKV